MRGSNLLWGLETLLKQLAPNLNAAGLAPRDLAQEILRDELISDSTFSRLSNMRVIGKVIGYFYSTKWGKWLLDRWRCATAIRSGELVRMLERKRQELLALPAGPVGGVGPAAQAQILGDLLHAADEETARILGLVNAALPQISPPASAAAPVPAPLGGAAPAAAAAAPAPAYTVQVDKIIQQVTDSLGKSVGKLETWFDSTMDRVSQRFVLQIRLWTIAFAFVLAFGLHFDCMQLL